MARFKYLPSKITLQNLKNCYHFLFELLSSKVEILYRLLLKIEKLYNTTSKYTVSKKIFLLDKICKDKLTELNWRQLTA